MKVIPAMYDVETGHVKFITQENESIGEMMLQLDKEDASFEGQTIDNSE